ncbi:hypothetical protein CSBG_01408 [Clostridium sp. 7_2_43FAA]|uniref:hypothetical protein n=1 Tax=Clostridium TaxID=1485 RepID=UPI00019B0087|nr:MULTISPECIES: hypothetical protein [Clostridium]EEH97782.1 hypothetical protein CSBG_01408 [Clostridium sp. 7_2_43FAA]
MKNFTITFMVLIFSIFTMGCERKSVDQLLFQGSSQNWEATINYDRNNKYKVNIKYIGLERLPMDVKFTIEDLSGNSSGGYMEYGEVLNKVCGFSLEKEYDYKLLKYEDKDKLTIVMEWNKQEEIVELNL